MTSIRLLLSLILAPAAVVIGLVRPHGLLALVVLSVFAAAVARVGLWLLDERAPGAADMLALRVGSDVFAGSVAVAVILLVLGSASVPVLAFLAVAVAAGVATRLRPARPAL